MQTNQVLHDLNLSLDELISAYTQILSAMQRQRVALVSRDASALETTTSEISALLHKARKAEELRDHHALVLSRQLAKGDGRPVLSDIVALAKQSGEVELAHSLAQSRNTLEGLLTAVRDIHEGNATIIHRRVVYGRFMMNMLAGVTGYGSDGTGKAAKISRMSIKA